MAAVARVWLDAFQDAHLFDKLPALLAMMQHSAEVAARPTNSPMRTCVPVWQEYGRVPPGR